MVLGAAYASERGARDGIFDLRVTGAQDRNASWEHILEVLQRRSGMTLSSSDFVLAEDRVLSTSRFRMYLQISRGLPIDGMSVRVWSEKAGDGLIQLEARLESEAFHLFTPLVLDADRLSAGLSWDETFGISRKIVRGDSDYVLQSGSDAGLGSPSFRDVWSAGNPIRVVRFRGLRGFHIIRISLLTHEVLSASYRPFRTLGAERGPIPVQVYPIYEEVEGRGVLLQRFPGELRYLHAAIKRPSADPFSMLRFRRYLESDEDPILGEFPAGQARGKWSMASVLRQVAAIQATLAESPNSFESGGVSLQGRFATVAIHPDAVEAYRLRLSSGLSWSSRFLPDWVSYSGTGSNEQLEMIPKAGLFGFPLRTQDAAWNRSARRLPGHDAAEYLKDGFDEVQVYWAITRFFESLIPMGFADPELSSRPFGAFLYNPDPAMRDNAFYVDDTIHFTTYSPGSINYARDNTTIWHELGHGLMERLMGTFLEVADTGGLSEGLADFLSDIVVQDVSGGVRFEGSDQFRISNRTGFHLTNEEHDDGEAYGGALKDLLNLAIAKYGRRGLWMVTDLVLETMRLCRNHPELTTAVWFDHLLFADSRGTHGLREPGAFGGMVQSALANRNFDLGRGKPAQFRLVYEGREVGAENLGSRERPVSRTLGKSSKFRFEVSIKNGAAYRFRFPVTVRVHFRAGPLQGPIRWDGEELNRPRDLIVNSERNRISFDVSTPGVCEETGTSVRQAKGCTDYVYLELWNAGESWKPQGKKRFYLRLR